MKKIILVILLNILFIDSAISQQVLQSRASYSLIKSTNERIYVKTYYEIHSVYFPIYEKNVIIGVDYYNAFSYGRQSDLYISLNDSITLNPAFYDGGFRLQGRNVDGNFHYTEYSDPKYTGAALSGDGKKVMAGGVYYTLDYEYVDDFGSGDYFKLIPEDTLWSGFTKEGLKHHISIDGTRYATLQSQPSFNGAPDSLEKTIIYTTLNDSSEWVGGILEFTHHREEIFEMSFVEDLRSINIITNQGIQEYQFPSADELAIVDKIGSEELPREFLSPLNDHFLNNHEQSSKIMVSQVSHDGLLRITIDENGLYRVYQRESFGEEFSFTKEFYNNGEYSDWFKQQYAPINLAIDKEGGFFGVTFLMRDRIQEDRRYVSDIISLDIKGPELEEIQPSSIPLVYELEFSEPVEGVTPTSFDVLLNDEVADPDVISIRAANRISNDRYQISFRTIKGPVSGTIRIGFSDSSNVKDIAQNHAISSSTTNNLTIENLDAFARLLGVPSDFNDLQAALDYSGNGDSVLVSEGEYVFNSININNKNTTLTSNYRTDLDNQEVVLNTILDTEISVSNGSVTVNGFTIKNGVRLYGDEYNIGEKFINIISNNNITGGASTGLFAEGDMDLFIMGNVIKDNNYSGVELNNNVQGSISDNIIFDNEGYQGAGIYINNSDPSVLNNLIINNRAEYRGGGIQIDDSFSTLLNNVIWGNKAKRGDQFFQSTGLPLIDHSVVQNYGQGTNVLAREGDNIYTEDPLFEISHEPITPKEGNTVINRFGVYLSISDSSILFGNGRSAVFDKHIIQTRVPIPVDSDADIGPFEFEFAMIVNPIKAPQLVYPLELDENPGLDPLFEWEQVKYSTGYEMMISSKEDFSENVSTHKSDGSFMSLDNPLDSGHEKYYWKVRGINSTKKGDWSHTHMFNVGIINSNEPMLEITDYELYQNYPNPFNPSTQIKYALPTANQVTLDVFNSVGQKVMELVNGQQSAGYHTATFDASGLSSGVYLYKLTTPSFTQTKKMLLIK